MSEPEEILIECKDKSGLSKRKIDDKQSRDVDIPSSFVLSDVHGFDYFVDTLKSEDKNSILSWMNTLRKRKYLINDQTSRLSTDPKTRGQAEVKLRNLALDNLETWKSNISLSARLIPEDEDLFSIICTSYTGRLIPRIDWTTSNLYDCSVFDRQSNIRISNKTYERFPHFSYAFSSPEDISSEQSSSKREYPGMFVYYFHTKDDYYPPLVFSMLSTTGTDSKPNDILLASPEALSLAEAPIISHEVIEYLENISEAIRNGETFNIQSSRKKGFTCITFGESSRYNSYRLRSSLWGVGEHGRTPTSFRFQLDTMISAMKELQVTAGELKVHPSSERIVSAHESETKFRESYNLLLSMYSWKKSNEYDGVSRAVLRSDMTTLGGRIERLLGLTSRRLGIGVSQQVHSGLDEIYSILNKTKRNPDDTGRDVLR
ncbi:MAG: hypothetical protein E4H14_19860 [Candidatus Thorarchaeota archaeon]|nr:MAG: hypothetical protein E4H14_19860 [Candidatus Thorarchaeota archaeon]